MAQSFIGQTSPSRLLKRLFLAAVLILAVGDVAVAGPVERALLAYNRGNYVVAARLITPLAEHGNADAQGTLGYMYETGRGVPQNLTYASYWYRRAAEQGHPAAQYRLGLQYDKGVGVPLDVVEAHKWLNLSTAGSQKGAQEIRARIRDAVATKMTRGEIAQARMRAVTWFAKPEP